VEASETLDPPRYKRLGPVKFVALVLLAFAITCVIAWIAVVAIGALESPSDFLFVVGGPLLVSGLVIRAILKRNHRRWEVALGAIFATLIGAGIPLGLAAWFLIMFVEANH
jgi:uncharacterized membrane protein